MKRGGLPGPEGMRPWVPDPASIAGTDRLFKASIFDVDGVLINSPDEQAWRDALEGFADPKRLTSKVYQAVVAGKPRLMGARAALNYLGVQDADSRAADYAERKGPAPGKLDRFD